MEYEQGKMFEQILSNQELILAKLYPAEDKEEEKEEKKDKQKRRTV